MNVKSEQKHKQVDAIEFMVTRLKAAQARGDTVEARIIELRLIDALRNDYIAAIKVDIPMVERYIKRHNMKHKREVKS